MSKLSKFISIIVLVIIVMVFCITFSAMQITLAQSQNESFDYFLNGFFIWPLPGHTRISSYFGSRFSPTSGASSYHSGIDIPATEGTPIYSVCSGNVVFSSWGAGGGYTIVVEAGIPGNTSSDSLLGPTTKISVSYCHVSPVMFVSRGDYVEAGQIIATVGPKNVYGIKNNPYRDEFGNPTNGATTGSHLHLTIKKDGTAVNPLDYFNY